MPLKPVALTHGASVLQDSQEETGGAGELPSWGLQHRSDTYYVKKKKKSQGHWALLNFVGFFFFFLSCFVPLKNWRQLTKIRKIQ